MANNPNGSLIAGKRAGAKAPAKAETAADPARWYRVKEDRNVPRKHGAFLLRKGKEIQATDLPIPGHVGEGYDLKTLKAAGVELEEIDEPGWYTEAQAAGRQKHQELLDAGVDVGDLPEPHQPTKARAKAPTPPPATS